MYEHRTSVCLAYLCVWLALCILNTSPCSHASVVNDSTPSLLLKFCGQIAEGMKYLSGKGFIHRDLAASNILLDNNQNCKVFSDARTLSRLVVCELTEGMPCATLNAN